MKRLISLLLVTFIVISLVSCSAKKAEKYCTHCGNGIAKSDAYCPECGGAVGGDSQPEVNKTTESTTISATTSSSESTSETPTNTTEETTTTSTTKTTKATTTTKAATTKTTTTTTTTKSTTKATTTSTTTKATTTTTKSTAKATTTTTTTKATSTTTTTTTTKATTTTTKATTAAHTHSYSKQVIAATCTDQGYTNYTCSCGDSYVSDYTNPKHSYSKYVCTLCGEVDKTHAYEYLIEWTKQNGEVDGTNVFYEYWDDDVRYSMTYSAQSDVLYICSTEYVGDAFFMASLNLNDYFYGVTWEDYGRTELFGYISARDFTSDSPITYVEYNGDESGKYDFIELSRLSIAWVLEWAEWMLATDGVGVTLSDLGFSSY